MRFLIAGFGSIGRRHLRNLRALGHNDVILYRTHRSTLSEEEIAGVPVETSLAAALERKPEGVIVANPTALHLEVAQAAVNAGCPVLIEKPVSDSLTGVDLLAETARIKGVPILVGYQFRFHPGLQTIRRWLAEEKIGRLVSFRCLWGEYLPDWHPWEDYRLSYAARSDLGGGVVNTLSHPLDYLRWLFGGLQSLWAYAGKVSSLEMDVEDAAEIGLHFTQGLFGSLHLDYLRRPPAHTLEITGENGLIQWDNADGCAILQQADPSKIEKAAPPEGFERNQLFIAELEHFIQVIRREADPVCTLGDGVAALETCRAVLESAEEQRMIKF